jgi:hypothetical protein
MSGAGCTAIDWNQVNPSYRALAIAVEEHLDLAVVAAGFKEPFAGFATLWGSRGTLAQALRRWPQYTGVGQAGATFANSSYHSLQISGERRMSKGFMFTMAYTFSKSINDAGVFSTATGRMDNFNRALDKSLSETDQPHILTLLHASCRSGWEEVRHQGVASKTWR